MTYVGALLACAAVAADALRGNSTMRAEPVAPAPAAAPSPVPGGPGLCGCSPVPKDTCACGSSLEFLKCVAMKCAAGGCDCPIDPVERECGALSQSCGSELEFEGCGSSTIKCEGRYHQAADGVTGLSLDTSRLNEKAHCGPHGRCYGELRLVANVYREAPGAWLKCVLPSSEENWADTPLASRVQDCHGEISSEGVMACSLPMVPALSPSAELHGHCYLTDGKFGKKLTKDAFFVVKSRYEESDDKHGEQAEVVADVPVAPKSMAATYASASLIFVALSHLSTF